VNEIIPIIKKKKEKKPDFYLISAGVLVGIALLIIGVATAIKKVADWGAEHQIVKQRIIDLQVRWPFRIEEIEAPQPEVIIVGTPYDELTSTEQKIIQVWGDYKTSMLAIAIFDCGESGLDQYAVSKTGDLGVAQINYPTHKKMIKEMGYTSADLLLSVDKNLEVAYKIWDRADGVEGNKEGNFNPWSGYKNGSYLRCFK
jgi:hypothetical protein